MDASASGVYTLSESGPHAADRLSPSWRDRAECFIGLVSASFLGCTARPTVGIYGCAIDTTKNPRSGAPVLPVLSCLMGAFSRIASILMPQTLRCANPGCGKKIKPARRAAGPPSAPQYCCAECEAARHCAIGSQRTMARTRAHSLDTSYAEASSMAQQSHVKNFGVGTLAGFGGENHTGTPQSAERTTSASEPATVRGGAKHGTLSRAPEGYVSSSIRQIVYNSGLRGLSRSRSSGTADNTPPVNPHNVGGFTSPYQPEGSRVASYGPLHGPPPPLSGVEILPVPSPSKNTGHTPRSHKGGLTSDVWWKAAPLSMTTSRRPPTVPELTGSGPYDVQKPSSQIGRPPRVTFTRSATTYRPEKPKPLRARTLSLDVGLRRATAPLSIQHRQTDPATPSHLHQHPKVPSSSLWNELPWMLGRHLLLDRRPGTPHPEVAGGERARANSYGEMIPFDDPRPPSRRTRM